MRKLFYFTVCLLAVAFAVRGGAGVLEWGGTAGKKELVILQGSLPDSLDPARNSSLESCLPLTGIYEGLVSLNPRTMEPEPCLAESWNVSGDGLIWTFRLRQGIFFSDGTACDAGAVKSSMARSMVLKDSEPYCAFVFSPVSSIGTEGKYTVSFRLKYPFAPFLKNLALPLAAPVVSPGALGRYGSEFWRYPSGTGPYQLMKMSRDKIVLQPNPHYRGQPVPFGKVIIASVPDPRHRAERLLEGRADLVIQPAREDLGRLQALGNKVLSLPGTDVSYLGFYTDKPPFNNKFVRMAVAYALNREKIVEAALGGDGVPAAGLVPPPVLSAENTAPPRYSPEQARRILNREGYPGGLEVTLVTYRDPRRYCPAGGEALAGEIKRQLEPAGIKVTVQSRPWNEHKEALSGKTGHFFLYGWTGDNGDADNFLYTLLASSQAEHGLNASGYKNGKLDVYLQTARRVADTRSREYLYRQAGEIIADEVPVTAINHSLVRAAHRPGVADVNLSGFGLISLHSVKKN